MPLRALCPVVFLLAPLLLETPLSADDQKPGKTIEKILEPLRTRHKLPALAAAVVNSKGLVAVGAVGVRKRGCRAPVTIDDQFHLGSDTKALTATMVGRLVEKGRLSWDTRLAKVFPELTHKMPPEFTKINLTHLLTHHSGLPANLIWWAVPGKGVRQQRIEAMKLGFGMKLMGEPGEKFLYSNVGYVTVGAMVERISGTKWEDLMTQELFEPLGLKSAGFGPAGSPDTVEQPWPHTKNGTPIAPGAFGDNPALLGPGGRVHMSLPDWSRFIADQLRGARGQAGFLQQATYKKVFTSPFNDRFYTCGGWAGNPKDERTGGLVLYHDGSNRMNYAHAWLAPEKDFALLVVTNQGEEPGQAGCHEAGDALIRRFLEKRD